MTQADDMRIRGGSLSGQAKEKILQYIRGRELPAERKLPREETLAELMGVSRITIRTALNELASEGILSRRQGHGTFINEAALCMDVTFHPVREASEVIRKSGFKPSVHPLSIDIIESREPEASLLGIDASEPLVCARKTFFADNQFCLYCVDYLALSTVGGESGLAQFARYDDSIFRLINAQTGRKIVRDKIRLDVVLPKDVPGLDGNLVAGLAGRPLLHLEGINYDEDDVPTMIAHEYIDTHLIRFEQIRQRLIDYSL